MGAADGDLGLLAVVHAELVAGLEPGNDFADVMDVDDEGTVRAPELLGVELLLKLFEGAAVGVAFDVARDDGDAAFFDGGEAEVFLVDEQEAALGADDDLAGASRGRCSVSAGAVCLAFDHAEEGVELGGGAGAEV